MLNYIKLEVRFKNYGTDMGISCIKNPAEGAGIITSKVKAIFRPRQQKLSN